jgi:hypothetical protein
MSLRGALGFAEAVSPYREIASSGRARALLATTCLSSYLKFVCVPVVSIRPANCTRDYSTNGDFYNLTTLSLVTFLVAFRLSNTNFAALTIAA